MKEYGFTLIELLIVIVILAIVSYLGITNLISYQRNIVLDSTVKEIVAYLEQAQGKSMSRENDKIWGVYFKNGDSDFYELYSTDSNYAGGSTATIVFLPSGTEFSEPTEGNSKEIQFSKLFGTTTSTEIKIAIKGTTKTKTISINSEGRIVFNPEPSASFLSGYTTRKPITITEQSGSNLTDYQILLTIDTQSLIGDSPSKMNNDCSDIRFTTDDGITTIPYWLEKDCNTTSTKIWVKVPSILANGTATIYFYYGNPSASSASNGSATFEFFDDFSGDLSKWTVVSNTWEIQADDTLRGYGPASSDPAIKTNYTGTDYAFYAKRKLVGNDGLNLDVRFTDKSNRYFVNERSDTNKLQLQRIVAGSSDILSEISQTLVENEWYTSEIAIVGSTVSFWYDGVKKFDDVNVGTDLSSSYAALSDWWGSPDAYFDDTRIRKYTSPEPTYFIGAEE